MQFPSTCNYCQYKGTCWGAEKPLLEVADCLLLATVPPPFAEDSTCPRCKNQNSLAIKYVRITGVGFTPYVKESVRVCCLSCLAQLDRSATEEESATERFTNEMVTT